MNAVIIIGIPYHTPTLRTETKISYYNKVFNNQGWLFAYVSDKRKWYDFIHLVHFAPVVLVLLRVAQRHVGYAHYFEMIRESLPRR